MCLLQIYQIDGMYMDFETRILGGEEALKNQWPFIAALLKVEDSSYFCGGTIVTNKHVLTSKDVSVVPLLVVVLTKI